MTIQKLRPTFTFTEERLRELQQVVPEAFADGKINWDVLREALGEYLEDETQEHFGLSWPGKREARRLAALPPQGALLPQPGLGVNEETTHNLFIEADNLEALKLLLKAYAGRVKLIYIDPPYNTGNDFVYPDDYSQPLEAYLRQTGQADEQGRRLTTNTSASGRYHSNWLSMMYPRLLLAHQFLRDDGVMFISIDDNEVHNLKMIMGEIFGEENFITMFVWEKSQHFGRQKVNIYSNADYVFAYAKNLQNQEGLRARRLVERVIDELEDAPLFNASNPTAEIKFPAGSTKFNIPDGVYTESDDPKYILTSEVHVKNGINENEFSIRFKSRWSQKKVIEEFGNGARYWVKSRNFSVRVIYQEDKSSLSSPRQIIFTNQNNPLATFSRNDHKVGTNEDGSSELNTLLGTDLEQMYPKPRTLLEYLLTLLFNEQSQLFDKEGIVLDFFAGSCTTAHAVLQQNREDGAKRQFVMVQLPEPTPPESVARKAGYATIADIGRERIRRVIQRMQKEQPTLTGGSADLGFRSYKLGRSHFRPWQPLAPEQASRSEDLFAQSPLVEGWTKDGLLTEILLLEGFPLDSQLIPLEDAFTENEVRRVHHPDVGHDLFVCLDKEIQPATVNHLYAGNLLRREDIFICLDSALTDEAKVRLDDRLRLKVI